MLLSSSLSAPQLLSCSKTPQLLLSSSATPQLLHSCSLTPYLLFNSSACSSVPQNTFVGELTNIFIMLHHTPLGDILKIF